MKIIKIICIHICLFYLHKRLKDLWKKADILKAAANTIVKRKQIDGKITPITTINSIANMALMVHLNSLKTINQIAQLKLQLIKLGRKQ